MIEAPEGELFPMPESERSTGELFPPPEPRELEHATGILPSQLLRDAIERTREIQSLDPIEDDQIQPASLDLRLGNLAHRVRASLLPGRERTVMEGLRALSLHTIDLREGAVLERDCIYIVPLLEHLALRYRTSGSANPNTDYQPITIPVTIPQGAGTKIVTITPAAPSGAAWQRQVNLTITPDASGMYLVGTPDSGTVYIYDPSVTPPPPIPAPSGRRTAG